MHILGALIVVAAAAALGWVAPGRGVYRAGPWPGLTARGAGLLLVCAWMLVGCELVLPSTQREARALPDLPLLTALDLIPPLLASCLVRAPGCASAVCGAYLLWRSLLSLVDPSVGPPPLLLPAALGASLRRIAQPIAEPRIP